MKFREKCLEKKLFIDKLNLNSLLRKMRLNLNQSRFEHDKSLRLQFKMHQSLNLIKKQRRNQMYPLVQFV